METAMTTLAIPILPCISLAETLGFYTRLGFEVSHQQERPNVYVALRRGELHLHFMGIPKLQPQDAYSACLMVVEDLEPLYSTICAALRARYEKLPLKGVPRISRLRPGASRFTLVDVAGNSLIFVRPDAPSDYDDIRYEPTSSSPLGKALHTARRLRDYRNDDPAAARLLDLALGKPDGGSAIDRARALAARAEIALAQGDRERADSAMSELSALPLTEAERARYQSELEAPERLERLR
jgi:hypothetical protein